MVFSHIGTSDFMVGGCYNIHWLISWGMKRITMSLNQLRVFLDLPFDGYNVDLLVPVGILLIVEAISKFSSSHWSLTNCL